MRARPPAVAVLCLMLGACNRTSTRAPSPPSPSNKNAGDAGSPVISAAAVTSSPLLTLDELASEGPSVAPLMHEVLRADLSSSRAVDIVVDHDLCVRAALSANEPVRAWFEDGAGSRSGEATHAVHGVVPPRGPVCATKGDALRLVISGTPNIVARVVIWSS